MNIGLFFGSFNPIHIGHLAIANYMVEFSAIDQVWFVVSPHNPLKKKESLLDDYQRLDMVFEAIKNDDRFRVSDIEFSMPKPSYTIDTLTYLKEKFPEHNFQLILGSDNLYSFHKWKNPEQIIKNYKRLIYPRPGFNSEEINKHENIEVINAPLMEISSSFIRKSIHEGKNIRHFLPDAVYQIIDRMNFYK